MEKFDISIASLPDKENLVAEIFYENVQWVQISQETDKMIIQFYPHTKKDYWEFPLDEALEVLERAKKRFLALGERREYPFSQ